MIMRATIWALWTATAFCPHAAQASVTMQCVDAPDGRVSFLASNSSAFDFVCQATCIIQGNATFSHTCEDALAPANANQLEICFVDSPDIEFEAVGPFTYNCQLK
jgi:hypothetical protein